MQDLYLALIPSLGLHYMLQSTICIHRLYSNSYWNPHTRYPKTPKIEQMGQIFAMKSMNSLSSASWELGARSKCLHFAAPGLGETISQVCQ